MESVYRKAKMYAIPSEIEGLSIALLEALSQHVPTIDYKECIGVEDVLIDGTNGYIFDSNKALSQKVLSIFNVRQTLVLIISKHLTKVSF